MASAVLDHLSDPLHIRALKVHRRRSKNPGQVAFRASGELKSEPMHRIDEKTTNNRLRDGTDV